MKRTSFSDMPCSIARTLDLVGEWWSLLIIRDIFSGIRRFDDLLDHLSISRNILTDRLDSLVEQGILKRHRYRERPERYEYRLTEKGSDLLPVLLALMRWGDKWLAWPEGLPVTLIHKSCGGITEPGMVCSACAAPLTTGQLRMKIAPQAQWLPKRLRASAGPGS